MKKIGILCLAFVMVLGMTACGGSTKYKDGAYYAESADFDPESGWKDSVNITVSKGKITTVDWNGTHKDGGDDKKTRSKNGQYDMKVAGAQSEWYEQASLMETELIKVQDPKKIMVNNEGKADAVSGVTIHISEFVKICEEALAQAKK